MEDLSSRNFGIAIAYLVPGFIVMLAFTSVSSMVSAWVEAGPGTQPSVGGFMFVTLASLAAGLVVSAIRWACIDSLHHMTGIRGPKWSFVELQENLAAFLMFVEFHYRYYQFYANTFVAIAFAYCVHVVAGCGWCDGLGWKDFGFVVIEAVLFAASRDTLRKYYARTAEVL